jgi:prepilin-type N-terminal cleavage/methylation domain-containing protein
MGIAKENTKGFTIIEVVLVLAIAGLIFLVVFLALPALQRGQRDTQRKADLGKVMSQVTSWQSNNQGTLPNGVWDTTFKTGYLTVNSTPFADPSNGSTYTFTQQTAAPSTPLSTTGPGAGAIWIYPGMTCGGTNGVQGTISTTSRTFAAVIYQEQGVFACQSN